MPRTKNSSRQDSRSTELYKKVEMQTHRLGNSAVTGAVVGVRSILQAEGVMRAGELRLTDEDVIEVEKF
jgi:hypothetical protein